MTVEQDITRHYAHGSLAAAVDESLVALGKDPAKITQLDLAEIDEFHIGGRAATLRLLDSCRFEAGQTILDVGSGLGGPARTMAAALAVNVVGIDLTPEFVEVARSLSSRVGLADRTTFQVASAVSLPFAGGQFDGATLIHVGMNIADKQALFRQIHRVLKRGAIFGIYDIMRRGDGELAFPLPWSTLPTSSFVERSKTYRAALGAVGFEVIAENDRVPEAQAFFAAVAERAKSQSLPRLTMRGPGWKEKSANLSAMVASGILGPREIIATAV